MKSEEIKSEETIAAEDEPKSELEMPIWSVITFDEIAASNLTYTEAAEKLEQLKAEKVSGLCVVTDETAARMTKKTDKK